jgi:Fe-S-cluster containining protein
MADKEGQIGLCPHQGCGFTCCEFNQGNYIVLYPGELQEARAASASLQHLEIIDNDYYRGARAVCRARDTSTCDQGYKPLDCATYPFFPVVGVKGRVPIELLKGSKCPLQVSQIANHVQWAKRVWQELIAVKPEVADWLYDVKLVGYEPVDDL